MKLKRTSYLLLAGGLAMAGNAFAFGDPSDFTLPGAYVQYGDAQSYALQVFCDVGGLTKTQCPFAIQSSDGQIMNLVNPANDTGNNGVITNFNNMDNAYTTPSGTLQQEGNPFFRPNDGPGTLQGVPVNTNGTLGTVANNGGTTWDTSVAALQTFLAGTTGGGGPVFFFNNNQEGAGGQTFTSDENLAAWAKIWITDASGNLVTNNLGQGVFYLSNMGGPYSPIFPTNPFGGGIPNGNVTTFSGPQDTATNPSGGTNASTDYILSGGPICTKGGVVVDCSTPNLDTATDNNLGSDQAAYAVVFPELNAILAGLFASNIDLSSYTLHLDVRLGCDPALFTGDECIAKTLNNGGEKIFIGALTTPTIVPEPVTLALIGVGLLGLGIVRRKASRTH